MMLTKVFFINVLLFSYATASTTVKVSVYYETLCPDSIAFIKDQLWPNYSTFGKKLLQLELIPYGFANETDSNGTKTFNCQHGPKECFGNLIHGIVINTQPIETVVRFVYCSERSNPPTSKTTLKKCSDDNEISWSTIIMMISNGKGAIIMSQNGKRTRELNPAFIPTIVFNDKFDKNDQDRAIKDFKGVVCKHLDYEPHECKSTRGDIRAIQI